MASLAAAALVVKLWLISFGSPGGQQSFTDEIIIKLCVKRMQLLFAPQQESIVSIMNLRATECHSYWLLISFSAEAVIRAHSLEIKGLFLMKISSKTLQTLPYFWNKNP